MKVEDDIGGWLFLYIDIYSMRLLHQYNALEPSYHGWEFALSLFPSSLFRSKSLSLKSDHDLFALVTLKKRTNMSETLSPLFSKEQT